MVKRRPPTRRSTGARWCARRLGAGGSHAPGSWIGSSSARRGRCGTWRAVGRPILPAGSASAPRRCAVGHPVVVVRGSTTTFTVCRRLGENPAAASLAPYPYGTPFRQPWAAWRLRSQPWPKIVPRCTSSPGALWPHYWASLRPKLDKEIAESGSRSAAEVARSLSVSLPGLREHYGALGFDAGEVRPDYVVCAGYKWLLGPLFTRFSLTTGSQGRGRRTSRASSTTATSTSRARAASTWGNARTSSWCRC